MNPIGRSPGTCPRRGQRHARRLALVCVLGLVLTELHRAMVAAQGDPDLLFALVKLSFLHGQATKDHEHSPAVASEGPL